MKFYPKLKIFKNSTGRNTFDGKVARSYDWYVYAVVLSNDTVVMVEKSYGSTTSKHMNEFHSLIGYDRKFLRVLAPRGLNNFRDAAASIKSEIEEIQEQLLSKRIKKIQERHDRIAELQKQLETLAMIQAEFPWLESEHRRAMSGTSRNGRCGF